uniref:VWFA domain-containing protein n=1 Tax=Parastrongyloides trichosuri TaxID=131310 RepID=A0A0N4ZQY6_PARTI
MDDSLFGSKLLYNQVSILEKFYENGNENKDKFSVLVTSQGSKIINDDYVFIGPNDENSLNKQINLVLNNPPSKGNISFYPITYQIAATGIFDNLLNGNIILIINSYIDNVTETSHILSYIRNSGVNIMAIAFGEAFLEDALSLVGSFDKIYRFNLTDSTNYSKVVKWIHDNSCSPVQSLTSIEEMTTTRSSISCPEHINIVVDASSDILTLNQFNVQISLIKKSFKSLIKDYTKISLSSYSELVNMFQFGLFKNYEDFDSALSFISQTPNSKLSSDLSSLVYNEQIVDKVTTYIFVSQNNNNEFETSHLSLLDLKNKGPLNIIAYKNNNINLNISLLEPTNSIEWDFNENNEKDVIEFFISTFLC